MNNYIYCLQRKNLPRLDVRICEACKRRGKCKIYLKWKEQDNENIDI